MKRELLAQSLAHMKDRPAEDASAEALSPPSNDGGPRSLKDMSAVLSQVASQAPQEIDPSDIADSEIADRFDVQLGLDDLVESISKSGQQLPALVRYRRGPGPRYEVVYGRRRIAACRRLGIKARTYVKDMDLREALMSQALENSARLERSFIEQAIFASRLEQAEFTRADICQALAIDKGTLSRLISVVRDVPGPLIGAIGAAHQSGRRPWSELRRLVNLENALELDDMMALLPEDIKEPDARLTALIEALRKHEVDQRQVVERAKRKAPSPATASPERVSGSAVSFSQQNKRITIQADKADQDFIRYLGENLEAIYENWSKSKT